MPRGFASIQKAAEKIQKASEGKGSFSNELYLKLPKDGDSATVRFLEQGDEVFHYYYHDFSHIDGQNGWKVKVPCLDQETEGVSCPGCREQLPRKFEGLINVIWRDAPVLKKDEDGKFVKDSNGEVEIDGHADQVAIWRKGITVFNKTLKRKDATYKGLGTRDFEIIRDGETMQDTTYSVEPADVDAEPTPLSEEDQTLADNKYDLDAVAGFVDEETFEKIIAKHISDSQPEDEEDISEFLNEKPFEEEG